MRPLGYGDCIMTSAVAREVHKKLGKRLLIGRRKIDHVELEWSDIWNGNLHFYRVSKNTISHEEAERIADRVAVYEDVFGKRPYIDHERSDDERAFFLTRAHAVELGCEQFKFKPTALKGDIFLSDEEILEGKNQINGMQDYIHIEPNSSGFYSTTNKEWIFERWQTVVNALSSKYKFIQTVKSPHDRTLKNVLVIPTPTFRIASYIVQQAALFLGSEGGLHHAAAAMGTKAVVIFGGFISPKTTGYPGHICLYADSEVSGCGARTPCSHCRRCMESISAEKVVSSVESLLSSRPDK